MSSHMTATSTAPLIQDGYPFEIPPSIQYSPAQKDPSRLKNIFAESLKETGEKIKRTKTTTIQETVEAKYSPPKLVRQNACIDIAKHLELSTVQTYLDCKSTEAVEEKKASRPKPNLSFLLTSQRLTSLPVCPPTPRRPTYKEITSLFCKKAVHIIDTKTLQKNGQTFKIFSELGMRGDHSQIYSIISPEKLVDGIENNQILIKIFHKDLIESMDQLVETELLSNSLRQYDELQQTDLPTCIIYNRDTAIEDGYLVLEKLQPLIVPWNAREPLKEADRPLLDQVKKFFIYAFNSSSTLPLDLKISNFGIKTDGMLALLDFMERKEDDAFAFHLIAKQALISLSNGNREVYEELRALVEKQDKQLFDRLSLE